MNKRKIIKWELFGFFFIGIVGAALHFTHELSDYSDTVAFFSATNESTWEHLKIVFWPGLLFALIEYTYIKDEINNYFVAKVTTLILMPFVIVAGWYAYAPAIGRSIFPLDLLLFYVAVAAGQIVSYKILTAQPLGQRLYVSAWAVFITLFIAFSSFTYFPPRMFLFEHLDLNDTDRYGILTAEEYEEIRVFR